MERSAPPGCKIGPLKLANKDFACFVSYAEEESEHAREELDRLLLLMGIQNFVWHGAIQHDGRLNEHITVLHPGEKLLLVTWRKRASTSWRSRSMSRSSTAASGA